MAVIASGGLSHFVVDEDLDHRVGPAAIFRDASVLGSPSRDQLRSANSEILDWVVAAGRPEHPAATVLDHPRLPDTSGHGCWMAFARWE